MTVPSDSSTGGASGNWLFKNKEHGKTSAAASLVRFLFLLSYFPAMFLTATKLSLYSLCRV